MPDAPTLAVWAALEPSADLETVTAELNRMIAAEPDLTLGGSAPERAAVATALGRIAGPCHPRPAPRAGSGGTPPCMRAPHGVLPLLTA